MTFDRTRGLREITPAELAESIRHHLTYSIGKTPDAAKLTDWRLALSRAIRDRLVDPWFATTRQVYARDLKRVCYLSMEFLIGRLLEDAIRNLGLEDAAREAMAALGVDYAAAMLDEPDAALGNGGLGRLAACFLDSMSTLGIPAHGYGIRYDHGLFRQSFRDGRQVEEAEDWLAQAHPWEFERTEALWPIGFGGRVTETGGRARWEPEETVLAAAYDTPIPGWQGRWVNTLRLWSAKPTRVFDLEPFNRGDFLGAAAPAVLAQTISRVLYPDDTTPQGKELRLKQEYFFTAASLRDLLRRFFSDHDDPRLLPQRVAIQLNDTHPAIAGPELVRLLMDERGLGFDEAFQIARGTLHYTNHTLMPEALEKWPAELMARVLPRHMQIIERIDAAHAAETAPRPAGVGCLRDGEVRMGDLSFIAARRVNGVSALHTGLMRRTVFRELDALHPGRIVNQTNGVTPRRWLKGCNPALSALITEAVGEGWEADLDRLSALAPLAGDAAFRERVAAAKRANKQRLAAWIEAECGVTADPGAIFDIQIKRIHEYKRQLMNVLEAAALWNELRRNPGAPIPPRLRIFGGKAAPGYAMAKAIIRLINDIARTINADPAMRGRLALVYPPNYNVTMAERLIPAADLSEQISTAGMEASGTGNMKFAMNGALTIGTMDGANVEIHESVGDDNIFIFGLDAGGVTRLRAEGYDPAAHVGRSDRLREVVEQIRAGRFSDGDAERHRAVADNLTHHDWFMVAADFDAYWDAQRRVDAAWADADGWARKAVLNIAPMGRFSSDRTIRGYASEVWEVAPQF
ncbi:glycogen/starch/alpha-glucan phosphorylase [Limibaculum sp. FT325]|uniref:glycogen/starch/alpha-glucan phosphorylase n=1 Tax=Thermohalobaculum sediminis TaxID=2939436 RepID=UPI0020BDE404|nr:glycogen/starch/alpha-glucan phosphorylase [Limibaculum sediminis]MCL5775443.1 glycogen/starch/alpha-glucan phosphorylase [Limibaculum sediminis]